MKAANSSNVTRMSNGTLSKFPASCAIPRFPPDSSTSPKFKLGTNIGSSFLFLMMSGIHRDLLLISAAAQMERPNYSVYIQRVLIIVNYDIDAICACKILQALFKTDYTLYTLVPVDFTNDLKLLYKEHHLGEKYVIFINCGGTIDIVEELEPEEDITFFILDSHRPVDVCNVYNNGQVVLLSKLDSSETVPDFNDIFRDDEDDSEEDANSNNDDDDDEDLEDQRSKRRKLNEDAIFKQRERKAWAENRDRLMFDYTQYGYYGKSSAIIMYELAWKLSKDNFDLLWYGIVGLSEQFLMCKITENMYITECGDLQNHASRLSHKISQSVDGESIPIHIEFENDLRLAFYRHWSIKASLTYSKFTATRLKLWTFQGEERLHEMLAEIGIPLSQCRQKFASMDLVFRKEFYDSIVKMSQKYNLSGIVFVSFFMQYGFRGKYTATDFVYGLLALLQSTNSKKTKADCFLECLEALGRSKKERLDQGIHLCKDLLISVFKQAQNALELKRIQRIGPLLYLLITGKFAEAILCRHPYGSFLLADFALSAYAATRRSNKVLSSPMLVCTPCLGENDSLEEDENSLCHITGIPPIGEESNKNFFGKAFEKAAENSRITIQNTYFDSSVIQLFVKDVSKFIDALAVLLS